MTQRTPLISVIIPTMCSATRRESLLTALACVLDQPGDPVKPIVVVNGPHPDAALLAELQADERLVVHYRSEASLPAALRVGRSLVRTPYFSFLDDDDEYFPGALDIRLRPMQSDRTIDVVITNGYFYSKLFLDAEAIRRIVADPLEAAAEKNWLVSCGALFRSASVPVEYFDGATKYLEWTFLAFKLAVDRKRIAVVDVPTYTVNDSPDSESKSAGFSHAGVEVLQQMLAYDVPAKVRRRLRRRLADALHRVSVVHLTCSRLSLAWAYHCRTLGHLRGLKYVPYTRHLLGVGVRSGSH